MERTQNTQRLCQAEFAIRSGDHVGRESRPDVYRMQQWAGRVRDATVVRRSRVKSAVLAVEGWCLAMAGNALRGVLRHVDVPSSYDLAAEAIRALKIVEAITMAPLLDLFEAQFAQFRRMLEAMHSVLKPLTQPM